MKTRFMVVSALAALLVLPAGAQARPAPQQVVPAAAPMGAKILLSGLATEAVQGASGHEQPLQVAVRSNLNSSSRGRSVHGGTVRRSFSARSGRSLRSRSRGRSVHGGTVRRSFSARSGRSLRSRSRGRSVHGGTVRRSFSARSGRNLLSHSRGGRGR